MKRKWRARAAKIQTKGIPEFITSKTNSALPVYSFNPTAPFVMTQISRLTEVNALIPTLVRRTTDLKEKNDAETQNDDFGARYYSWRLPASHPAVCQGKTLSTTSGFAGRITRALLHGGQSPALQFA